VDPSQHRPLFFTSTGAAGSRLHHNLLRDLGLLNNPSPLAEAFVPVGAFTSTEILPVPVTLTLGVLSSSRAANIPLSSASPVVGRVRSIVIGATVLAVSAGSRTILPTPPPFLRLRFRRVLGVLMSPAARSFSN
jgi:hypothetical protein